MKIDFSPVNIEFKPLAAELIKQISEEINKPKKVAFLAIDSKTNKSVHYGSADYPLKRIKER